MNKLSEFYSDDKKRQSLVYKTNKVYCVNRTENGILINKKEFYSEEAADNFAEEWVMYCNGE